MASFKVRPTGKDLKGLTRSVNMLFLELFKRIDGSNIDAGHLYLNTLQLVGQSTAPTTPSNGMIYFNSSDKQFWGYNGDEWVILG